MFMLAIVPLSGESIYLLRAESPGPSVSKMVPKMRTSAAILYAIYCAMTLLQILFYRLGVLFGWGEITWFDSLCLSFGTAGTGGFSVRNSGLADYSAYLQAVTTVFMILFGVNFSVYFFLLRRRFRLAWHNSEVRWYFIIIFGAIVLISANLLLTGGFFPTVFQTIHHVAFSVGSVITTTGFGTADFAKWPEFSKTVLLILMAIGACAGSTGGGMKVSRVLILAKTARAETFDRLFSYHIPALVFARNIEPMPECMQMAEKHDITILRCLESTSYVVSSLITYLKNALAPRITRHGVFVEVYGEGLLLMGESGIGKSEAAAELLKRGHRLIADDAVEIRKVAGNTLRGTSPELIRNYIEIRGIGVINVAKLFGMAAIKDESTVDLVVNIVPVGNEQIFDRLGLEEQYMDLLGVKVPAITIPVRPGRNLAIILEVAAMNNRQKKMGYNAAAEFTEQINRHFDETAGQSF